MTKKRYLKVLALSAVLTIAAAACSSGNNGNGNGSGTPTPSGVHTGGTYRTAIEDFGFTGGFDPTGEYLGEAFGLYSNMLLRSLLGYRHVEGLAGDQLIPDLAASMPQVSNDQLTYTFKIRQGVKFGPPVNRQVTSKDVAFAFQRIESKALVAQYGFYYDGTIVGMNGPVSKPAQDIHISGIETPDPQTIVFHLQKPTGDFLYRLSMPATAPIPPEVGKCFTNAGDYGRDIIATGPYMIRGEDKINTSSCSSIKPEEGFDPTKKLILVRNPSYEPSSDSTAYRANYLDGWSAVIDTNTADIFDKVTSGALDGSWSSIPPPDVLQNYLTDPTLKPLLHSDPGDRTWYITMNLLVPPFDDVHVRKAVNLIIDKSAMLQAKGGPTFGQIATHIFPPTVLNFGSTPYDPYNTPNESGDLNAAKNEMAQSKYDHNHDGICDDPVCKNVLLSSANVDPYTKYEPIVQADLAKIGINTTVREVDSGTAYTVLQTVNKLIPISVRPGWGKDYADPYTFAVLFQSAGISCQGQVNYSEVGMTQAQAKQCGVLSEWQKARPDKLSIDSTVTKCYGLTGTARNNCWIQMDKDLMENVVPWVPYQWGTHVTLLGKSTTNYEFDQFSTTPAWSKFAVSNNINPNSL